MSNAADRDSDQFGIKMSVGRDLSLADQYHNLAQKRRKVGTMAKVSNTITYAVVSCHHIPSMVTS